MIETFTFCEFNEMTLYNYIACNPNLVDIAGERLAVDELHIRVQRLVKIVETAKLIHMGERICGDNPWNGSKVAITISSIVFHDQFLSLNLRKGVVAGDIYDWKCNALKSVTQSSQLTQRNCPATTTGCFKALGRRNEAVNRGVLGL